MGTRARELMPSGSSVKVAASQHPVVVYLAGLAEGPGRVAMRSTLKVVAAVLGNGTLESTPWHELRFQHVAALRSKLAESYAPASVNKSTGRGAWCAQVVLAPGPDGYRQLHPGRSMWET